MHPRRNVFVTGCILTGIALTACGSGGAFSASTTPSGQDGASLMPQPAPVTITPIRTSTLRLEVVPASTATTTSTPAPVEISHPALLHTLNGDFIAMAFSPDGKTLATLEITDNSNSSIPVATVRLWNTATGEIYSTLEGSIKLEADWQSSSTEYLRWSPDGTKLAAVSDETVTLWDGITGQHLQTIEIGFPLGDEYTERLLGVAWSGGRLLAGGESGDDLIVWEAATGQALHTLTYPSLSPPNLSYLLNSSVHTTRRTTGFAWSPYGATLVAGDVIGKFYLWNPVSGALMRTFKPSFGNPLGGAVAFSPDGSKLISAARFSLPGRLELYEHQMDPVVAWDVLTGEALYVLDGFFGWVSSASFSPDGAILATGTLRGPIPWEDDYRDVLGDIIFWDAQTGTHLNALTDLRAGVFDMIWSPAGDILAARGGSDTIMLWSTQTILSAASPPRPTPLPTATSVFQPDSKVEVTLYLDTLYDAVTKRIVEPAASLPETVLREVFAEPEDGGFTGFSQLRIQNGIAYVYLIGQCNEYSPTVSLIYKNLLQFPEIRQVRVLLSYGDSVVNVFNTDCLD